MLLSMGETAFWKGEKSAYSSLPYRVEHERRPQLWVDYLLLLLACLGLSIAVIAGTISLLRLESKEEFIPTLCDVIRTEQRGRLECVGCAAAANGTSASQSSDVTIAMETPEHCPAERTLYRSSFLCEALWVRYSTVAGHWVISVLQQNPEQSQGAFNQCFWSECHRNSQDTEVLRQNFMSKWPPSPDQSHACFYSKTNDHVVVAAMTDSSQWNVWLHCVVWPCAFSVVCLCVLIERRVCKAKRDPQKIPLLETTQFGNNARRYVRYKGVKVSLQQEGTGTPLYGI